MNAPDPCSRGSAPAMNGALDSVLCWSPHLMRVQSTMRVVRRVLDEGGAGIHVHAFTVTFSTLTRGRLGFRRLGRGMLPVFSESSILPFVEPGIIVCVGDRHCARGGGEQRRARRRRP